MSNIYIVFVDTPGIFASIIRFVLKQKYIHVAIAMDKDLDETYSFGRRNPYIPFSAGFVKEDKRKILKKYPDADYMVCRMTCSVEQKEYIRCVLCNDFKIRFHYHYTILGLLFVLIGKPFKQKRCYTCSSYLAKLLEDSNICHWKKHTSIVTPKDFYNDLEKEIIFEGPLRVLVEQRDITSRINHNTLLKEHDEYNFSIKY